jgi:hypothetical protein
MRTVGKPRKDGEALNSKTVRLTTTDAAARLGDKPGSLRALDRRGIFPARRDWANRRIYAESASCGCGRLLACRRRMRPRPAVGRDQPSPYTSRRGSVINALDLEPTQCRFKCDVGCPCTIPSPLTSDVERRRFLNEDLVDLGDEDLAIETHRAIDALSHVAARRRDEARRWWSARRMAIITEQTYRAERAIGRAS